MATTETTIEPEAWLDLLLTALDHPEKLLEALQAIKQPPETIPYLFEITMAHLATANPSLLMTLLHCQNRMMIAAVRWQPPSMAMDNVVIAITKLAETLLNNIQSDRFMEEVVTAIANLFHYQAINLFLAQNEEKKLVLQAGQWHNVIPSAEEMAAFTHQVLMTPNIITRVVDLKQAQTALHQSPFSVKASDTSQMGEMAVPLKKGEQLIGVLHTFDIPPTNLTPQNLGILQLIANQLVMVMENTRLQIGLRQYMQTDNLVLSDQIESASDLGLNGELQALARQMTTESADLLQETQKRLAEVSSFYTLSQKIISSLDLDELLDHLVHTIRQVVDCRACVIFLFDETKQYLEIKAAAGLRPEWRETARLHVGQGAAGQSVAQKKTIYIPDTRKDPNFIFFDLAVRSLIVVPLIYRDKAIGAINLDDSEPNAFGRAQERLLSVAATQAAIAIENALLFSQVRSEEQQTRAIIQHMADGLLMIGPTGVINNVNPRLVAMVNLPPAEIIGQNIYAKDLNPRLATICTSITTLQEQTGISIAEVSLPEPEACILQIFATTVTTPDDQPLGEIRVIHDVTKERALEKMKDDLLSTVSHELRTPLFSIQGFIYLLLNETPPDTQTQREFLTIIEREVSQLSDLVADLLDSDKLSNGTMEIAREPVELVEIINQTAHKLQGFAHREKVTLTVQIPVTLPVILGDAQRLEQILTNLVGNAIKFTPADGSVMITTELSPAHVTIMVADTGIGIAESDLSQIFTKFYQAENAIKTRSGSGLGLFIAKQLIEEHHGQIWAESQSGQGSTFFIQLPILA